MKRSEGHVKIGVHYLSRNNFRNYVQYCLPLVLLFLCALCYCLVCIVVTSFVLLNYVCTALLYT